MWRLKLTAVFLNYYFCGVCRYSYDATNVLLQRVLNIYLCIHKLKETLKTAGRNRKMLKTLRKLMGEKDLSSTALAMVESEK